MAGGVKVVGDVLKSLMRPFVIGLWHSSGDLFATRRRTPKQVPPANIQIFQTPDRRQPKKKSA